MPTILCFGDSNTHGIAPMPTRDANTRYGPTQRWPGVLASTLAAGWSVIEEGLPGRTTCRDDPVMGVHMNGQTGLRMALSSHQPIDVLTIMLGTNDLKTRFAPTAHSVTAGMAGLLDIALNGDIHARHGGYKILLIAPPPVIETGCLAQEFYLAEQTALAPSYETLAAVRGCGFLDAGTVISCDPLDGVHFAKPAHAALGHAVATAIGALA